MDTENPMVEQDDDAFLESLHALLAEEPASPPPQPKASKKPKHARKRSKKPLIGLAIAAGVLAIAAVAIPAVLRSLDPYGGKMAPGVHVGAVDVSGLSKSEAKKALTDYYGTVFSDTPMIVRFPEVASVLDGTGESAPDTTLTLTTAETGAKLDAAAAVKAAYALGRDDTGSDRNLPLTDYLNLDKTALQNTAQDYAARLQAGYRDDGYRLEGDAPDLAAFDETVPCQKLILTKGYPAVEIDGQHLYEQILDGYENQALSLDYDGHVTLKTPEDLDLDALWAQTRAEAQEPSVDLTTYQVVPGVHGYEFDLDEVKTLWANVRYGGELELQLHYTSPTVSDEDAFFQDTLGYCETPHGDNENRNSNLRKACEMLDGLILEPGQEFSYNDTLGERTEALGWKPAPAYSGTTLVDSPGGGICQVSSTLYLASVYAELTVLERVNHGYPVSYIPLGMDATVNWGFTDLKLRNDSPLPVKIHAEESDGYVRVTILGTETRNYTIEMTYSVGGRHVRTYMSKYDKATGELISKESVALSSYLEDIYK